MMPPAVVEKIKRDAITVRGLILNHYATVEFAVDELLYRCRRTPPYREAIPLKLPRPVEDKLALLARVIALPGPLAPFADELLSALAHLNEYTIYRHLAAHGRLKIEFEPEGAVVVLEKFRPTNGELGADYMRLPQANVEPFTRNLSDYALTVLALIDKASAEADLPTLEEPDA